MQWLINLVRDAVLANLQHIIVVWFKPIADIPEGWGLCDGTNGLPDLREKFIKGTAVGVDPGGTGGTLLHKHGFTSGLHDHILEPGDEIAAGTDYDEEVSSETVSGTTGFTNHEPPFYEMVFIGKL